MILLVCLSLRGYFPRVNKKADKAMYNELRKFIGNVGIASRTLE